MIKNRIFISVFFSFVLLLSTDLSAQDELSRIRGMDKKELLEYLGSPTRSGTPNSRTSSETLFYGSSQILLINGRVASWSDTGELRTRIRHFTPQVKETWESWPNPWTPPG